MSAHIDTLFGDHPLQGWGRLGKKQFYFHAKYGKWLFCVGNSLKEALRTPCFERQGFLIQTQPKKIHAEAKQIIYQCAREYEEK
jgi:hypothetical protein